MLSDKTGLLLQELDELTQSEVLKSELVGSVQQMDPISEEAGLCGFEGFSGVIKNDGRLLSELMESLYEPGPISSLKS